MIEIIVSMINSIIDFIISPIGQIVLWGSCTFGTFAYVLYNLLDNDPDSVGDEWRVAAITLMSVFWTINVSMWFAATISWMMFSDIFFAVISLLIFRACRQKWAAYLTGLYCVSVSLDVCFWQGLPQVYYAWLSNITYAIQLLTVSGRFSHSKQKL